MSGEVKNSEVKEIKTAKPAPKAPAAKSAPDKPDKDKPKKPYPGLVGQYGPNPRAGTILISAVIFYFANAMVPLAPPRRRAPGRYRRVGPPSSAV